MRRIIDFLMFPPGSRGLDAGCGIGLQALLLAEAVGTEGKVTGVDRSTEFLAHGERIAAAAGVSDWVSFVRGEIGSLPFEEHIFDWVWSSDCVIPLVSNPQEILKGFMRVLKPGGRVVVLAWSSQLLLPGYPLLEARLNATPAGIAPFCEETGPESHFMRMLHWFRLAGLEEASAYTFAHTVHGPLRPEIRRALISLFDMRWGESVAFLAASSAEAAELGLLEAYQRLCMTDSKNCIIDLPDYCAFFTYSLFSGKAGG